MYDNSSEITALVSARICHDLASPLGAIANGMELLELSGLSDLPEAALVNESIASAKAKIEFIRVAYGIATSGTTLPPAKAQKILTNIYAGKRFSVRWTIPLDTPRPAAKLLFLLIQCADSALPLGGEAVVSTTPDGWFVTCTAKSVRLDGGHWALLSSGADGGAESPPVQSSHVHFALAALQVRAEGHTISYTADDNNLTIKVAL
jgi:histidine phosphotransferase ChpT